MDTEIKVGTILIAKDVCAMYDGTGNALIIRNQYPVIDVDSINRTITIQSELREHDFSTESIEDPAHWSHFFAIKPMDTTTPAHTPTPKVEGSMDQYITRTDTGRVVAKAYGETPDEQKEHMELIVTAVNSHESNVKRIQELEALIREIKSTANRWGINSATARFQIDKLCDEAPSTK